MPRIKPWLLVAILLGLVGMGLVVQRSYQDSSDQGSQNISTKASSQEQIDLTVSEAADNKQTTRTLTQISSEGSTMLRLERTATSYDVWVEEVDQESQAEKIQTKNPQHVFTGALESGQTANIPFNTWSPNNAYFFLKLSGTGADQYLVFKTSGEPFGEDPFLNVTSLFTEKGIDHQLRDVTGWAANGLLLVQTESPSYWFEVASHRFIILSTQF